MSLGDAELGYSVDSGEMGLGLECVGCKWLRAPDLLSLMFHHAINCGAHLALHWNKPSGAAKHVINVKIVGAKPWNGPAPGGTPKRNNRLPLTHELACPAPFGLLYPGIWPLCCIRRRDSALTEIFHCASQKSRGFNFLIPVSDRRDQIFSRSCLILIDALAPTHFF
jgi:hypothetical protein